MNKTLKRLVSGVAALAVVGTVAPLMAISPAAAATLAGEASVKTAGGSADLSSGDSNDVFTLRLPAGAACAKDGNNGGRWHTYMVPTSDGAPETTLAFQGSGAVVGQSTGSGGTGTFRNNLYTTTGNPIRAQGPDLGTAAIINIPNMDFDYGVPAGGIPSGTYNIGIACVDTALPVGTNAAIDNLWNQTITVTYPGGDAVGPQISWVVGVVDEAPVLTSVTAGDGTLTAAFTHTASDPTNTTYTATATPTGGGAAVEATGTGSPITIGGLTNATEYSVTVKATNLAGDSAPSNAITGTPTPDAQPPVQNLTATPDATPDSGIVNLDWTAPAGDQTPTGYEVTVDPAVGVVTVNDADTSAQVTGLTPGTPYTFTVTALYAAPYVGTPASVEATPLASGVTILEQNVTVTRPAGALVFTQICENTPGAVFSDAACAIAFGTATRVIPAAGGAPHFAASASLNNVQVDNFGDDNGWTVTGDMSEFVSGDPDTAAANQRFSGDQLGWAPAEVSKTDGMTVNLGGNVAAGQTPGMSASPTLASSPAGSSLGIAELDADLDLVIPTSKRAGLYTGTLTMTAMPGS